MPAEAALPFFLELKLQVQIVASSNEQAKGRLNELVHDFAYRAKLFDWIPSVARL
jgi:hypothetical protein